jgi:hypothetical protein
VFERIIAGRLEILDLGRLAWLEPRTLQQLAATRCTPRPYGVRDLQPSEAPPRSKPAGKLLVAFWTLLAELRRRCEVGVRATPSLEFWFKGSTAPVAGVPDASEEPAGTEVFPQPCDAGVSRYAGPTNCLFLGKAVKMCGLLEVYQLSLLSPRPHSESGRGSECSPKNKVTIISSVLPSLFSIYY